MHANDFLTNDDYKKIYIKLIVKENFEIKNKIHKKDDLELQYVKFCKKLVKIIKNYDIITIIAKGKLKMKKILIFSVAFICLTGCSSKLKKSTFECFDTDGNKGNITLTYEEDSSGQKVFYDGDQKIGYRSSAIDYASEKTGGMTCHAGTDR